MDIKLIAVDMDGTLLGGDHLTIPPENIEALRAAARRGIKIVIATGRTICLLEQAAQELGVVDYALAANGAGLMDWSTRQWLHHMPFPEAQWRAILTILRRRQYAIETYADGMAYLTESDLSRASEMEYGTNDFARFFVDHITRVDDVAQAITGKGVEKIHIFYVPPQELAQLKAELEATGPLVFANGDPTNLELTVPGADKGKVLAALCEELGIAAEQVMAFGDGDNDLGMLAWAGQSFSMENGSPNAKAIAKYCAPSNGAGGVGQMIEKHILRQ